MNLRTYKNNKDNFIVFNNFLNEINHDAFPDDQKLHFTVFILKFDKLVDF